MAKQYCTVNEEIAEMYYWTPFLKQLHVSSCAWALYFVHGLATGAPTVFMPQIRRDWNSTVTIDDELASWLYSMSNFAAIPWIFYLPALSQCIGRKKLYIVCCFTISTVFSLLYFSSAPYHILIAEGIQGFVNASAITVLIHLIPEYCDHRYRSMYLNIQGTCFYWGIWMSNAIGTFFNWKYIAVLGLICSIYSFTVSFYPESPRWLASKRKFKECEAAHRWLQGPSPTAEKKLRDLIKSQADYPENDYKMTCSMFLKTLKCKQFYMPLLVVILIGMQYNFSGKFVCSIYAIEILKKITNDENTAYTGMLILDGVSVFGMYIGSALSKFLKFRTLFLSLSFLSICVMFIFSIYLYLSQYGVVNFNNILSLGLLVVYSLAISSGPVILCLSIYGELISIRYQAISYVIISFFFLFSSTGMLKFSPIIFKQIGIDGSFLFFGISSGIATTLLYFYLPETKNKTLIEIEEYFKDVTHLPKPETLTMLVECKIKNGSS